MLTSKGIGPRWLDEGDRWVVCPLYENRGKRNWSKEEDELGSGCVLQRQWLGVVRVQRRGSARFIGSQRRFAREKISAVYCARRPPQNATTASDAREDDATRGEAPFRH